MFVHTGIGSILIISFSMISNIATMCSCLCCWKVRWAVLVLVIWTITGARCHSSSYFEDPALEADSLISWSEPATVHKIGRTLLQERSNGTGGGQRNETYTTLVAKNRIDPLNHFRRYKGGYNIKSKHYWGSTVFTGAYGYAIAAVWIIAGVVYGIFLVLKYCCCSKNRKKGLNDEPHSNEYYIWHFRLIILLTIVAIVTSSYVLAGNSRFHTRAKRIEKTVVGAAERATETIHNVTSSMKIMQEQLQPYDKGAYERLNKTAERLESIADDIDDKVHNNKRAVDIGLKILYIAVAVLVSIILVLVIFAIAVQLFHWRQVFCLIIFICSLLTALSWLGFGLFFAIHTFADDSCLALKQYQDNPYNTTLDSILPCMDLESADDTLAETRAGVHVLIRQVNRNITNLQKSLNFTLGSIPHVCDPFSGAPDYEYRPNGCPNNTIQIGEIPELLEPFKCSGNNTQECIGEGKYVTQSDFDKIKAYTTSTQNLLDIFPDLQSLTNCSFVKDTFSTVLNEQCSPLKSALKIVWVPLVVLSASMIALVISWIVKAYQYGESQFSKGSIIPQDTPMNSPKKPQNPTNSLEQMDYVQTKTSNQFVLNCT